MNVSSEYSDEAFGGADLVEYNVSFHCSDEVLDRTDRVEYVTVIFSIFW